MYAQRGHGKRSSYYSDYTFGVWTKGEDGDVLVPVGKAYFGFTDEELIQIDRFVRRNTVERFGRCVKLCMRPSGASCSKLHSRDCSARHATNRGSPCASHASAAYAGTSRPAKLIDWKPSSGCWRRIELGRGTAAASRAM
jgi:hypothetical protein